jgi:TonB family protein
MRLAVPVVLAVGCGGGPAPEPVKPVDTAPKKVTRVPIEDDSDADGPEDGVTFVKTKGTMRKEAIEAGLAPHSGALAECYTGRVGKRRWLGGHVVVQWNIKADGTLSSVKLTESNLGSWLVEQCLLDVAWSATFAKPAGGDAEFTVPLDFSARGGTAIWDEDQTLRAVGGQLALLDDCDDFEFEPKGKKRNGKKPAKPKPAADSPERPEKPPRNVTITMYVGPAGKLQSVGFSSATSEVGQKWAACAEQAAQTWRLPDPRGQIAKAAVRYRPEGN